MMELSKQKMYFFRYLTAFCVPVLCIATLFLYWEYRNQTATAQSNALGRLQQLIADVDYFGTKIQSTALHMSDNDQLTELDASHFDPASYSSNKIFGLLCSYENNLPSGASMVYYVRGGKHIYSNGKFISYDNFVASDDYTPVLGRADFYLHLNSVKERKLIGLRGGNDSQPYCAALYYPIPEISDAANSTACFLIQQDHMVRLVDHYFEKANARAVVTDARNQVIFSNASLPYSESQLRELLENNPHNGVMRLTVDGVACIFLRGRSGNLGLNYGILIPRGLFYQSRQQNLFFLLLLVGLMFLFSLTAAFSLAASHYSSILHMDKKARITNDELEARNDLIREMVLRRLVKGTIENGDETGLHYNLRCSGIHFLYNSFAVAVLEWQDLTLDELLLTQTISILEQNNTTGASLYAVRIEEDNRLVILVNFQREVQSLDSIATKICDILTSQKISAYTAGLGSAYDSPFQIDDSYVEALVAIRESMRPLSCGMYLFCKSAGQIHQYPYVEYSVIEQSVQNGNAEIALDAMRQVVERLEQTTVPHSVKKCLYFDLINMVIKIADKSHHPLSDAEIIQLSGWDACESFLNQMEKILSKLAACADNETEELQKNARYTLVNYVQENFRDNSLTLESLASHFGLSYTYVSKIFKEETGFSFLAYLTQFRFQYIKAQLLTTDIPIKEIAASAGYNDLTNFTRKFKSMEGVTPGEYRRSRKPSSSD